MSVTTIDQTTIFEKTMRGRAEMGRRLAGMGAVHRQVFIVIDGRRDMGALATLFPARDMAAVTEALWREGWIAPTMGSGTVADEPPHPGVGPAKALMAASARECIGLLADQLIVRIDAAQTLDALMVIAGQWHMAMRESKRGRALADERIEQVRGLLGLGNIATG